MDAWIKSPVDTNKYPNGVFKLYLLMVTGIMPLCLVGIFKGVFSTTMLCCHSRFLVYVKNEPSLCMNSCLYASQLYDKEYLFCMSMPNQISVSSSLSHMMKVWEILKLAIQKCKVALPSKDIADPSAFFRYTAAGTIFCLVAVFNHVVDASAD